MKPIPQGPSDDVKKALDQLRIDMNARLREIESRLKKLEEAKK